MYAEYMRTVFLVLLNERIVILLKKVMVYMRKDAALQTTTTIAYMQHLKLYRT
tara:strand:- start:1520 stop:1678 length:159 start_codon:yes stop_codon:yes gene_type:complete